VRPLGGVLQTIGGYGFHIYDDSGAGWITIHYETDAARWRRIKWPSSATQTTLLSVSRPLAPALCGAFFARASARPRLETCNNCGCSKSRSKRYLVMSPR
jgi:hypothetical protein